MMTITTYSRLGQWLAMKLPFWLIKQGNVMGIRRGKKIGTIIYLRGRKVANDYI